MPLGGYIEINNTRVVPSPRPSDRVPFGTGASISRWLDAGSVAIDTYPLAPFNDLRQLFALVPSLFKASANDVEQACRSLASPLREYLTANDCVMHIRQASENSASPSIFARRFFVWFDGLRVVKYLNASCRDVYPKQPPTQAAAILLQQTGGDGQAKSATELLKIFRKIERSTVNYPQTVHF